MIQILAVRGVYGSSMFLMSTSMNPRPTDPHHNLHNLTMVLTRQSILAQSSRVSTRSNYGRQFFVLGTNRMYSHSSNLHCWNQEQILYSQPLSTPLLHSPDNSSFGISYLSFFYALNCLFNLSCRVFLQSKRLLIPNLLQSGQRLYIWWSPRLFQFQQSPRQSPMIHANPFLLPQNLSHQNPKLAVLPLAVLLIITLVLLLILLILFPPLIQIKLALYQHPCNNLWTDGLLWATNCMAFNGISLPVSGYAIISHCSITILVAIEEFSIDSTSSTLFMLLVLLLIVPVLFTASTISASSTCTTFPFFAHICSM